MGKKTIRKYTSEFKQQAAGLANRIGTRKAAEQLGVPVTTLYQWKGKEEKGKPQSKKEEVNLEAENKQLRKEVEELKKVNFILKKAAAFFSQDHLK
ncbi:MAG: transposase [Bdellovibrionales bacterium]|nr:transposase [Bdellovibrionales bacterium]